MSLPIRWKVALFTVLPVLGVYSAFMVLDASEGRSLTEANAKWRLNELAQHGARLFDSRLRGTARCARMTAAYIENHPHLTSDEIYVLLQANLEISPLVYGSAICFEPYQYDSNQRVVVRYVFRDGESLRRVDPAATGYDYTTENQQYWHVPRDTGKPLWTEPYYDEGGGNILMSTYSVPFFRNGEFWGVATVDIPLEPLRELANVPMPEQHAPTIITRKGTFVFSPVHERINRSIFEMFDSDAGDERIELAKAIAAGQSGITRVSGWVSDEPEWAAHAPMDSTQWGFVVSVPERTAMAAVRGQARRNYLATGTVLVLVVVGLWFFSVHISMPITSLARAVKAIAAGDVDARAEKTGDDEIGLLADSFNDMAGRIAEREKALRESEERFRAIAEDTPVPVCRFLPGGVITYVNAAFCRSFAKTSEELVGQTFLPLIPEADRETVMADIAMLTVESPTQSHEHRVIAANGEIRWHRWTNRAIFDAAEQAVAYQAIGQDVTERKRAEEEHLAHLHYLESMERIDQAIRSTTNLEQMLTDVLDTTLSVFQCDRAWLLYPCDPSATSWQVPMESTRPEYPGVHALGVDMPMNADLAKALQTLLDTDGPVRYDPQSDSQLGAEAAEPYGIKSQLCMAVYPKQDKPWVFGLHQCSHGRVWTEPDQRIFQEIGRRIADATSSLVFLRNLEASERRFRTLVSNIPGAVYESENDPQWTVHFISDAIEGISGYPAAEFVQNRVRAYADVIHPDDVELVDRGVQQGIRDHEPFMLEYRIIAADGVIRWVYEKGRGVWNDAGELTCLNGVIFDITEHREAFEEIRHLRNYLKNVIDSMPSVLIGVDAEGVITQWNLAAERATSMSSDEAAGQPLARAFPRLGDVMESVHESMLQRQTVSLPRRVRRDGGETRFEDVTVFPLIASDVKGAVIRVDDVTDRVRIEEMMVQTEKMMSVGGLAAGMAHEINNPLGGIIQGAQNIQRRVSSDLPKNVAVAAECGVDLEAMRAYLEKRDILRFLSGIRESGARAARIVGNMLQFSRRSDSHRTPSDLSELIDNTLELASSDYDLRRGFDFRYIELIREYDPDLPTVSVVAPEIEQVLLNILRNAAQAMLADSETKKPRLILRTMSVGDMARIEIEDNGPGMPDEVRRRVFEPFYTTKPVGTGTGLGLSVSYMIVTNNHGGRMTVESTPKRGAKFVIELPLR